MSYFLTEFESMLEWMFEDKPQIDHDILDVEPIESSTERSGNACSVKRDSRSYEQERAEDILRIGDYEHFWLGGDVGKGESGSVCAIFDDQGRRVR